MNAMTGKACDFHPLEVRGGILADSMGLGKSLTIISLLATEWQHNASSLTKKTPTLIVVPPSLLRTWEEEIRKHLHPKTLNYCLYHGPRRSEDMVSILGHDIVITTYNVVATEWKSLEKGPRPLFLVTWRRIILDEGKLLLLDLNQYTDRCFSAHEIRVGSTMRAKAICALRGDLRWAVSGTPIQNRWEDLASLLNFLRVYPDHDIRSITNILRNEMANSNLRSMLTLLCLRRSKQAIDIPSRRDTTHRVEFDAEEAAHYNSINLHVTGFLDQQAGQANLRSYTNILVKINSLRQICNLGTCYQGSIGDSPTQTAAMQELFDGMVSAGTATCYKCEGDLSTSDEENEVQSGGMAGCESFNTRITTCGRLVCAACLAICGNVTCPTDGTCQYQNLCKLYTVKSSSSTNLSTIQPNSRLSAKMRVLQEDILALPKTDKR